VQASGLSGGYAFRGHTGPLGEILAFKANTDTNGWNAFASIRASALAAYGYHEARANLWRRLPEMGFAISGHSVNRIDFAMDFATGPFELNLGCFVAHPRTKVTPHWGSVEHSVDRNRPSAVCRGRRLESVTIGKMPGRQSIVYDKRRQAIEQRKLFWFEVWGVAREDSTQEIWRIELRAGKKELKDRWQIRTFDDVDRTIGDVFHSALGDVRYVLPNQTDSNVTRQSLHPIWIAAFETVENGLLDFRSGVLPSRIREIERQIAIDNYERLVLGNLAGLAAATGMTDEGIEAELVMHTRSLIDRATNHRGGKLLKSVARARERLHFVSDESTIGAEGHSSSWAKTLNEN
jgi:hypothetical protein